MRLIQEADELAYRCAFACQKQAYIVKTPKGDQDFKDKYTKTEIINHCKKQGKVLDEDYTIEGYSLIEREHIVKYTLEKMIEKLWNIEHELIPKITDVELWLSPSDHSNFRYKVVEIMGMHGLGYKVGRGAKPHWLQFIRDTLINEYGAQEIFGYEADDALGMVADSDTILSHIDKDINMIEGWHYNHVTQDIYYIQNGLGMVDYVDGKVIGRGLLFFYIQLLTGDPIDNIPGCKNPTKAHHSKPPNFSGAEAVKLLNGVCDERVAFNYIKQMFIHTYEKNWHKALMECSDLLWIVRHKGITGSKYLINKGYL